MLHHALAVFPNIQYRYLSANVLHRHFKQTGNNTALQQHYGDFIIGAIASQITTLTIVYSTVYSDADQRTHQSSASLAFVWEFTGDR